MKVEMVEISIRGLSEKWDAILRVLGEENSFQPLEIKERKLIREHEKLLFRIEDVLTNLREFITNYELDKKLLILVDSVNIGHINLKATNWTALIDNIEALTTYHLGIAKTLEPSELDKYLENNVNLFLSSSMIENFKELAHLMFQPPNFTVIVGTVSIDDTEKLKEELINYQTISVSESLNNNLDLMLIYCSQKNVKDTRKICEKYVFNDLRIFISLIYLTSLHNFVEDVYHTIELLSYFKEYDSVIEIKGYIPKDYLSDFKEKLTRTSFEVKASTEYKNTIEINVDGDLESWKELVKIIDQTPTFQPSRELDSFLQIEEDNFTSNIEESISDLNEHMNSQKIQDEINHIIGDDKTPIREENELTSLTERLQGLQSNITQLADKDRLGNYSLNASINAFNRVNLDHFKKLNDFKSKIGPLPYVLGIIPNQKLEAMKQESVKYNISVYVEPLEIVDSQSNSLVVAYCHPDRRSELSEIVKKYQILDLNLFLSLLSLQRLKKTVNINPKVIHAIQSSQISGNTFSIKGYIPNHSLNSFRVNMEKAGYQIRARELVLPSYSKPSSLVKPFSKIVEMYSQNTPSYNEIDPTTALAITLPIFFGLMFGDIGHGIVLLIAGLYLLKGPVLQLNRLGLLAYREWGTILTYCALASIVFGMFVGEFFGFHLNLPLIPVLIRVRSEEAIGDIFSTAAQLAISVGFMHLTVGLIFDVKNKISEGEKVEAMLRALPLVFTYIFASIYMMFATNFMPLNLLGKNAVDILNILLASCLVSIIFNLFAEPIYLLIKKQGGATNFINGFMEFMMSSIELASNTVSYVRLSVLFIVHTILMKIINDILALGVITWPAVIIGNIGVICLEGLIVFIQALRLHFYEFFSRFYKAEGSRYSPIGVRSRYGSITWTGN